MRLTSSLVVLLAACFARTQSFERLGDLPGGATNSHAQAVSSDGRVVVGYSVSGKMRAVRWTRETGMTMLADVVSAAYSISADGTYIGGYRNVSDLSWIAFRYSSSDGMRLLGQLGGRNPVSITTFVSLSGDCYGLSATTDSSSLAFAWSSAAGIRSLGDSPRASAYREVFFPKSGINSGTPDAGILAGYSSGALQGESALYDPTRGWIRIGSLPGAYKLRNPASQFTDLSSDGKVAVGFTYLRASSLAMRWSAVGGLQDIGDLEGGSRDAEAYAVSQDGRVIVGRGTTAAGGEAFIYDDLTGMRRLADVAQERGVIIPEGWMLFRANDITIVGGWLVIVGTGINPSGKWEGFRIEFAR